jgi:hypothetical protein
VSSAIERRLVAYLSDKILEEAQNKTGRRSTLFPDG